ncbi:arylamine N-acetyltransferase [Novosphingobium sp. PhB165]|uniref:arylamine N-acetyltransferase family protein n=1 Tax=Novosphingobium sp. PhB165 TaxID=2485105 RepID=UPI001A9DBEBA|nr:arylamine N-acetyltransferase [Novosphingobium sp. PhB165]
MNLDRYLARIGLDAAPAADPEGLAALQLAHRLAIGFENLAIPLGEGIRIDSASVFDKLVMRGRGGYCFEQNRLFSDVLSAIGLVNRPLLARVLLGLAEHAAPPRTHTLLLVNMQGAAWIADAGFGGSFVPPMPLEDGAQAQTPDGAWHRLLRSGERGSLGGEWRLERAGPASATDGRSAPHGDWQPQYIFDLSEVAQDDLEMGNHWTSTRPNTRFTTLCVASVVLEDGFAAMTDRQLSLYRNGASETRDIADAADYARTLREVMGIDLSDEEAARLPLFA